jgi:hypothetical protein
MVELRTLPRPASAYTRKRKQRTLSHGACSSSDAGVWGAYSDAPALAGGSTSRSDCSFPTIWEVSPKTAPLACGAAAESLAYRWTEAERYSFRCAQSGADCEFA